MYKYKNKKQLINCPMGTLCDGLVDCYWFGKVTLMDCEKCTHRTDNKFINKKNSGD